MSRYSPARIDVAGILDALAQVDTRTDTERAQARTSAATLRASRRLQDGTQLQVVPFSDASLPRPRLATRGTSNRDQRGNTRNRHRRKLWLLEAFGDGTWAKCTFCPVMLDIRTITVDRWPIAGVDGGRYVRGNIRPSCGACASEQGGRMATERRHERQAAAGD